MTYHDLVYNNLCYYIDHALPRNFRYVSLQLPWERRFEMKKRQRDEEDKGIGRTRERQKQQSRP